MLLFSTASSEEEEAAILMIFLLQGNSGTEKLSSLKFLMNER
jgi:hypothetical protein